MITTLYLMVVVLWACVAWSIRHELEQQRRIERLEGKYAELRQADENLRVLIYPGGKENKA